MLKLKPSARLKRRYIKIICKDRETIEKAILDYIGTLGWAKAAPVYVSDLKLKEGEYILAVERKMLNDVRASFEICKEDIKIVRVSGTIKGLTKNT